MAGRAAATPLTRRQALAAIVAGAAWSVSSRARAAVEPTWVDQRRVGPFVCRSAFPLDDALLADADLASLERELRRVLALGPCKNQVEVVLLNDAQQHRRYIAERHPTAPYRRALYYQTKQRAVIYTYRHSELAIDLRHECTHALLHADLPMVPLWLDEGLAEYFEPRPADRAHGPDHLEGVVSEAARGRLVALTTLEAKHDLAEMADIDYRYAWAWTHFLLHGPAAASMQLWATLAALRRYEPPTPMSQRLAATLGSPETAFAEHFRAWPRVLRASRRHAGASR
ncbi:hypothetical protein [Botrimarina mediterranea]|uniref:hypothetical protein n=1 Tax=Botrimarina mediterranea TaxID=2528022 RepID=UPI001189840C|nr:hypothetical protein K2D_16200 [Planctomycetes bacterium K2D]